MNVVVAGGGTVAAIDDVRQITNASTGRFSAEIAEACLARGATVRHVHAPTAVLPFARLARFDLDAPDPDAEHARLEALRRAYESSRDRLHLRPLADGTVADYAKVLRTALAEAPADVAFLAMAVSDFEPERSPGKVGSDREGWALRLHPTPKVIRSARDWAPGAYLVGFKLLSGASPAELIEQAARACIVNRVDLTIANDLKLYREGRHTLHLVRPGREPEVLGPRAALADELVDRVLAWARGR